MDKKTQAEPMFVTWDDEAGKEKALAQISASTNQENCIRHTQGTDVFRNIAPNTSVRDGFSREDYDYFRPEEARPDNDAKEIKKSCMKAYRKIGLVHNMIDLMTDFTCQGIHPTHSNRYIQKFYETWWSKVNGGERSERFVNKLLGAGTTIVQRTTAKLKQKDIDNLNKGFVIGADVEADTTYHVEKNEIPWKYTFLNPLSISVLGDELATFAGDAVYVLDIPARLTKRIKNPKNNVDKQIIENLPENILNAVRSGQNYVVLDKNKTGVFHYKKDDWEMWGDPLIYPVLDDLILLEKMKLADVAALDGAVSHIRLWKLGSLEHKLLPTPAAMSRLAEVLLNNVGGGAMDLVWGPELTIEETGTEVYKFLGKEKYGPILEAIYAGLGIPPTLTGSANASGFTNNYISLKTLVERLNYVRMILVEFWDKEIKLVQRAMRFRFPAQIQFDRMTLSDEAAEKALLIQLVDRNVISLETAQERFGEIPELERVRIKREWRERKNRKMPRKTGPYTEQDEALQKIALQTGIVTPSEVGLELDEKKPGEVSALKVKQKEAASKAKGNGTFPAKSGTPSQGRPKNSGDSKKRKKKRVIPRTAASFMENLAWARKTQKTISDVLDPVWLQATSKKDLRSLSYEEFDNIEKLKFAVLCNIPMGTEVSSESLMQLTTSSELNIPKPLEELCKETISKFSAKLNKEATLDDIRQIQASACALYYGDFENGKSSN